MAVREALASGDPDAVAEFFAPDAVWVGSRPGMLCRNLAQILAMFERAREGGRRARPEILDDLGWALLVDPHVEPPPELNPQLHQVLVLDGERIVEIRDYADRPSASAAFEALR